MVALRIMRMVIGMRVVVSAATSDQDGGKDHQHDPMEIHHG
jgi:hypothetical protein